MLLLKGNMNYIGNPLALSHMTLGNLEKSSSVVENLQVYLLVTHY